MKVVVTMKTPDAIENALRNCGLKPDTDEWDNAYDTINKYFRYGEYVDIQFDIETGEASIRKKA